MPTAIVDVDLDALPGVIPIAPGYTRALVLVRIAGEPVGQVLIPVRDGRLAPRDSLGVELARACERPAWVRWVGSRLATAEGEGLPRPTATVAVCTRDRPDDLEQCLAGIAKLDPAPDEVLVVDNAPTTDATERVVAKHPGIRYVREDQPGLNTARNRALREARTEIVAFTDDDAIPDHRWLGAILRNFTAPGVLSVTGLTLPAELETEAQEAFERVSGFGRGFARRGFSLRSHNPLVGGPIGAGVNLAVRREVLDLIGPFDEDLDAGTPTQSGGDHDLFTRILRNGWIIVYDPGALVRHRHRRSWAELVATIRGYGVGVYAAWTRALIVDREAGVFGVAWGWFWRGQLPGLIAALRRSPNAPPLELVLAELKGCLQGPRAYFRSRRRRREVAR